MSRLTKAILAINLYGFRMRTKTSLLSHPLRVCSRAIKLSGCLEGLEFTGHRGLLGLCHKRIELVLREGLESTSRLERLIQTLHGIAAIDDHRRRQIQRVVETFDRGRHARLQHVAESD